MTSHRFAACTALAASTVFVASLAPVAPSASADPTPLVVHEWGTFTSIAGIDGHPIEWRPLGDQSDLPCFVERHRFTPKVGLLGTVRMETPVIYFYSPRDTSVSVRVDFRHGLITEWYPRAAVTPSGPTAIRLAPGFVSSATWPHVTIAPFQGDEFPVESAPSHYYAARETDAAPIAAGSQREKFLFYRGVGRFALPLTATVGDDGTIDVKPSAAVAATTGGHVETLMLFENRGGRIGYELRRSRDGRAQFTTLPLTATASDAASGLEEVLRGAGLYDKEARAMIDTWRDSWFEEGSRLIYIVPQPVIDAVLPLDVSPRPAAPVRVFVGRLELLSTTTRADIVAALASNDAAILQRYGRFARPLVSQVRGLTDTRRDRERIEQLLRTAEVRPTGTAASCSPAGR